MLTQSGLIALNSWLLLAVSLGTVHPLPLQERAEMGSNEMLQTWKFLQFNRDAQITKRWVKKAIPAHQVLKKRYRHSLEYPSLGKSVTKMAAKKTTTMDASSQLSMRSELSQLVRRSNAM